MPAYWPSNESMISNKMESAHLETRALIFNTAVHKDKYMD